MRSINVRTVLLLAVGLFSIPAVRGETTSRAAEQRVDLLQMIARQIQGNLERIGSWEGKFKVVEAVYVTDPPISSTADGVKRLPGEFIYRTSAAGAFILDWQSESLFTEYRRTGDQIVYENVKSGEKHFTENPAYNRQSILTPEHYLNHNPAQIAFQVGGIRNLPSRPSGHGIAYRQPAEEGYELSINSAVIDPRQLCKVGQTQFAEYFAGMAGLLIKTPDLLLSIERTSGKMAGYLYTYVAPSGDMLKITIDETSAFQPVRAEFTRSADGWNQTVKWRYQELDGIQVPSFYHKVHLSGDGTLLLERELHLSEVVLNRPVPKETFSYAQFGLKDGDRLLDEIRGEVFVFDGGELISPDEYRKISGLAEDQDSGASVRIALVGANLLAIIVVAFLVLRKRYLRYRQ